ncbi:hypothetical protein SAMN05443428_1565 [Caloramator quimbayensis]|uniref:Uncharacterized protein n=1 Tax=Caloramator quimbayensis TaxID=1147123 RepID=A0A1T4YHJ3_9CLOT|nr:hypothetical protein [Caloramator quimbayensis]SKB01297.1 hypothetical protein SAMN05443428_1565 [Caloramator quimbayensis]
MRKHLAVILFIMTINLLAGTGTAGISTPTSKDEVLSLITIEQTEPFEPVFCNN